MQPRPVELEMHENSTDCYGRIRLVQDAANDYLIDREAQREGPSYTGIRGGAPSQDTAVSESMGNLLDRSLRHLGTSDMMVVRARHRLIEAVQAFVSHTTVPPGVYGPEVYRVRSGQVVLPEGTDWLEGIKELVPAYRSHPELDLGLDRERGARQALG